MVFAGVFCESGCAERGFLYGKRGDVCGECVAGSDSKKLAGIGPAFLFIF
jgi:hypothetical protein